MCNFVSSTLYTLDYPPPINSILKTLSKTHQYVYDNILLQFYEKKETEVLEFIHDKQKLVVFGFRGTEPFSISDWSGNFNLQPGAFNINGTTVSIHKGFVKRYGYIASWFEQEYKNVPQNYR